LPNTIDFARNLEDHVAAVATRPDEAEEDENFNDKSQESTQSGPLLSYQ
jgi:hypothetical protein